MDYVRLSCLRAVKLSRDGPHHNTDPCARKTCSQEWCHPHAHGGGEAGEITRHRIFELASATTILPLIPPPPPFWGGQVENSPVSVSQLTNVNDK